MENQQRETKGIWIPIEIWKDKDLTWNEKILFLEIDSYTSKDKDCFFSNEYISELLGISQTNANKVLSSLISKGYVVKTKFDGRRRYVKTALSYSTTLPCQEQQGFHTRALDILNNNTSVDNNKTSNKEIKELKEKFASFVKKYKKAGGRVRGVDTEFNDFSKRHKDWKEIIPYLDIALEKEIKERESARIGRKFYPEMKNLQTYLGKQRAWEMFVTVGEDISTNEYMPSGHNVYYDELRGFYYYTGFYMRSNDIMDGYTDEERPDGAKLCLNNGRGVIEWNGETLKWEKVA